MQNRLLNVAAFGLLLLPLSGCPLLIPNNTTVRLVNNGDFPIQVDVRFDEEQDIPEDLLRNTGTLLEFTIAAGQNVSFTRNCDDLQAVMIESADLQVLGQVGPQTESGVLRDGDDFNCRDTVTFTFDHSALLVDFDVTSSVQ